MESNYLFQNCNSSTEKHTGGGLPFWKVFMDQQKNAEMVNGATAASTDPRNAEQVCDCTPGTSRDNTDAECSRQENGENDTATKPRRRPVGSFDVAAIFDNAAQTENLFEGNKFNLKLVREIKIEDGSTGYGYDKIFADGIDKQLKSVSINEPYVRNKSQIMNIIAFCELLVTRAQNLREIVLCTQTEQTALNDLWTQLKQLRIDLMSRDIALKVRCSCTMHDREIRFDNGWTFRIGRGLDYFQKQHPLTLGLTDLNLRKCQETVVCILKEMRSS